MDSNVNLFQFERTTKFCACKTLSYKAADCLYNLIVSDFPDRQTAQERYQVITTRKVLKED